MNSLYLGGGIALAGLGLLTMGNPNRETVEGIQLEGAQAAVHAEIEGARAEAEHATARLRYSGVCILLSPVDAIGNPVSLNTPGVSIPNVRPGVAVCDRTGNTALWNGKSLTAFAQLRDPAVLQQFLANANILEN